MNWQICVKRLLPLLGLVALPVVALGNPLITNIDGGSNDGLSISISGTEFGQKATPAPLKWDKFDIGTDGSYLYSQQPEWVPYSEGGAKYSSNRSHSGGMALGCTTSDPAFNTNYIDLPHSQELFISYWWMIDEVEHNAVDYGVVKLSRINSSPAAGGGGRYNGEGDTVISAMFPKVGGSPYMAYTIDGNEMILGYVSTPYNEWCRVDMYKKVSTPGVADGAIFGETIGRNDKEEHNSLMTCSASNEYLIDTVLLGLMIANSEGYYEVYLDDMYVDNTLARVELGDNPVFDNCGHREMQLPTAWSASGNQIDITINQGTFTNGSQVWLFVVDADGNPSPGYELTLGGELPEGPPSIPGQPQRN